MDRPVQVPEISSTTPPFEFSSSFRGQHNADQSVQVNVISSTTTIQSREVIAALERLVGDSLSDEDMFGED